MDSGTFQQPLLWHCPCSARKLCLASLRFALQSVSFVKNKSTLTSDHLNNFHSDFGKCEDEKKKDLHFKISSLRFLDQFFSFFSRFIVARGILNGVINKTRLDEAGLDIFHAHSLSLTRKHTHKHSHICAHTHTQTPTHTHIHTHVHTHTHACELTYAMHSLAHVK